MERSRLRERYQTEVVPAMMEAFKYKNALEVPHLQKIIVNTGVGEAIQNAKLLEAAVEEMAIITGQRPVVTRARKSISAFKLREGMAIGCKVTLRGDRMYHFFDRLVNIALPRVRDFRGVSPDSFDGRGSYSLGIREQLVFPEIDYDQVEKIRGMSVTVVTNAASDEEGKELLRLMGMPFKS
ncbi:MAG: 50S ribosomal protein L5 [Thermaerobacterales bacterium]